ncbi:biopolymer transporter ExbD [Aliivibrio sifiae]
MKLNPFQKKPSISDTDLNITPFLSLMVVLIPVLLVSAKFSLLAQYDIYSNDVGVAPTEHVQKEIVPYRLVITTDTVMLYQGGRSLFAGSLITSRAALLQDFKEKMGELSESAPLSIQIKTPLSYQDMVGLLDIIHQSNSVFSSVSVAVKEGV